MYPKICEAIHREMEELETKYDNGTQMSMKDLEDIDIMAHALKSLATYSAMVEGEEEYRNRTRYSGRRY